MERSIRVLVVDDYLPFRGLVRAALHNQAGLQVIGEAADGIEAVLKAQELQPDLIVLDIGLPALNGIEAVRRIRDLSPKSRILFLSANRSWDIAEQALRAGASGYVVKSAIPDELLSAVEAVLQGNRFVSTIVSGLNDTDPTDATGTRQPRELGPDEDQLHEFPSCEEPG